ncbi:YusU family protein [Bacillus sp. T33-2]|uniref:YusU family protein n=1 Tax=Bacillus sp. T33-2 TaxID=2054168 RepID=UPI000C7952CF|nr:YusU family protein [Bacillus sp. T33-2]PLR92589.1 DUF2573 domain-containing protein [Bacillus sp. T33-2]
MDNQFYAQLDGLLEKYTELLVGNSDPDRVNKVKAWIIYNHIAKSMPPLARHWNSEYPDAKEKIVKVIAEVRELNQLNRKNSDAGK